MAGRRTGERAGLTRERVLAVARDLVADAGLQGLTMRALGQRLQVNPNALYNWVGSKDSLLDALLDDALAQVRMPDDSSPPVTAVRHLMIGAFDALLAQGELAPLHLARRTPPGPASVLLAARLRELLTEAGVAEDDAQSALSVLIVHTLGFAAFVVQTGGTSGLLPDRAPDALRRNYVQGLDWLLTGLCGSATSDHGGSEPVLGPPRSR